MNKYALPLAAVAVLGLQACNEQSATTPAVDVAAETASVATNAALESSEQRLSYGIAYGLGSRMLADAVPMDIDAFTAGFRDALEQKEPQLTQEEIQAEMQAYQDKMMAEQAAQQEQLGAENAAAAADYLAKNAEREGVVVTDSGLQYEVVKAGEGRSPGLDDQVEVHYRGTLLDGTEFDSSYSRGQTVTFGVGQVIAGWTEALQLMKEGATYKLTIPSDLAYGPGGAGQMIGPNETLLFDVELVSIVAPDAAEAEATDK